MVEIPYFQIDAFTGRVFAGNPAGVCLLEAWLADPLLQAIAAENGLSETAFLVRRPGCYELRWFTPQVEVDLCGHATLASAHCIFEHLQPGAERVAFTSKSGTLHVERRGELLYLDFPARPPVACSWPSDLVGALGFPPREVLLARDLLAVYENEAAIRALQPDLAALSRLDAFAVIVTAPGERSDFVSRFFAPGAGIPEDPVTGSAHCTLIPYWSGRLGRRDLHALQLSRRGGELFCQDRGERVGIGGRAVTYLSGRIRVPK